MLILHVVFNANLTCSEILLGFPCFRTFYSNPKSFFFLIFKCFFFASICITNPEMAHPDSVSLALLAPQIYF